jgi:uncharacterized protein YndB with AHSA1/START domain
MKRAPASLVFKRSVPAAPAEVYEAWTSPEVMQQWLAPGANVVIEARTDVRVGGAFRIRSSAPDGALHTIDGTYRELRPGRRLAMTWRYSGPVALLCDMDTLLEIELREAADGTTAMTVTHSRIATPEAAEGYGEGWPTCFDKLERTLCPPRRNSQK